jgi:hypothetical protein
LRQTVNWQNAGKITDISLKLRHGTIIRLFEAFHGYIHINLGYFWKFNPGTGESYFPAETWGCGLHEG